MDHSEARKLVAPFGAIPIYHLSGESGWKAVSSDIPPHGMATLTRSGIEGRSVYASDAFIRVFCHEAALIPIPTDDDLQLIAADQLPSFDPECVAQLAIVWSERTFTITSTPVQEPPRVPLSPRAMLRAIDLDFTKPLLLPDGTQPPLAASSWVMAITKKHMTAKERALMAAVRHAFRAPGAFVTRIGPDYATKVEDTLRKLWGVYRRHLRVPHPYTLTLALFDPHNLAYYFRLVASPTSPGRNYSPASLATEVLLLRHLLKAFMTLATVATRSEGGDNCGIRFDQMPYGLDAEDVLYWLKEEVTRAVSWKKTVGGRKKERDVVCKLVSETQFEDWVTEVQASVEGLIAKVQTDGLDRTPEMAEYIQDLCVALLLGAGMPPQRSDVLSSLELGITQRCGVQGCNIHNCPGNRILTRDEYVQHTGRVPEPEQDVETYYILSGHYKNYTADSAAYKGPTIHTPVVTGKHLNFILGEMASWASDLLRALDNEMPDDSGAETPESDDTDEDYAEQGWRYLLVDYEKRGSKSFHQSHERFAQYVRRCTKPVSQPPSSFRFLFARMVEHRIDEQQQYGTEADGTREKMARAMLSSLSEWNHTYASPRTRMPLPGFQGARDVVYGNGSAASTSAAR